jgi:ABC-type transport system substrate-binding protein/DNA-binding SARP family transcriptional activator/streptogramin lyase
VEFRILGPLEVRADGLPVPIGGPRQRALLALLLLNADRAVSRDQLIDELVADGASENVDHVLNVQISRLRKTLAAHPDGAERIIVNPPGYLLHVRAGELDLHRFEGLVADGRRALEAGEVERAAETFRAAEALWRGRPLADLEFEPFAKLEIERLEELRLAVVEERIDVELDLGRHARLVPELERLVAEHPLRERLRGQQMLALYRSGRQVAALETFRAARTLLSDELGLDPSPQLRELERAILRHQDVNGPESASHAPAAATAPAERRRAVSLRSRRDVLAIVGAIGICVAAGAVALMLTTGSSARPHPTGGDAVALVSADRAALKAVIPLRAAPTAMTTGFGSLWVAEGEADRVVRVDPRHRNILDTTQVGRGPSELAAGAGSVWAVNSLNGTVSRVDPGSDTVTQTIMVGSDPDAIAIAGGSVWVASHSDGTIQRIDPATGRVHRPVRTGLGPSSLAAGDGSLWVANDASGTVVRLSPATAKVVDTIHVGDAPSALAADKHGVWVLDRLDSTVSRLDPETDRVESTIPLTGDPTSLLVSSGAAWVADANGTVRDLDASGEERASAQAGHSAVTLAADNGIWVGVAAGGAAHLGGTLRMIHTDGILDTIDPAASTSWDIPPPKYLGLTNDGLVTLDHASGPEGARLVPDLAVALPRPSAEGTVYAFRLRPGIRFSNGTRLGAGDVRHSFERLFELHSSGADVYSAILGAGACVRSPRRCDLARGIRTDDRTGTVTFTLAHPDPDFLYKLTLPYADVLPASAPDHEAKAPLPATGPYMIVSYTPGKRLRMARNPYFHQWSAAAQPDGYPDRIEMRLELTASQGARRIAEGADDLMTSLGPIPGSDPGYFLVHHPNQVHANPGMGTNFDFLNVRVPPFNDLRVRRALNLALDRGRIAAAEGGPSVAQPTCQLLPPGIAGYGPYCPYTRHPDGAGNWHGPDLARARKLVAASGTKGMKVTVWDVGCRPCVEGDAVVRTLRELGYRASHRIPNVSVLSFYNKANNSRNRYQIIGGGWGADYPSADDFLGKLTCSYFVPANGVATTDASEFCDHSYDMQVERAAVLQNTDTPAANKLWTRLDHELTDRAILLPTVTLSPTDLVSRRVGDYHYNPVWGVLADQLWLH